MLSGFRKFYSSIPWWLLASLVIVAYTIGKLILPLNAVPDNHGDAGQMVWNIYHSTESIVQGNSLYVTNEITFPRLANLTQHTLSAGYFPVGVVSKILFPEHTYPFFAFNLVVGFVLFLNFIVFYFLIKALGLSDAAASISSLMFSFTNYLWLHSIHLNLIPIFIFPLVGFCFLVFHKKPSPARGILLGASIGASIYISEYALFSALALSLFVLLSPRRSFLFALSHLVPIFLFFLSLFAFSLPFVASYFRGPQVVFPSLDECINYSANFFGFFAPDPYFNSIYPRAITLDRAYMNGIGGFEAFLGYPLIVTSFLSVICLRASIVWRTFILGIFFIIVSMGPDLHYMMSSYRLIMPFDLIRGLPFFGNFRTPVRFVVLGLFFLSIAAAYFIFFCEKFLNGKSKTLGVSVAICCFFAVVNEINARPLAQKALSYDRILNDASWIERENIQGPVVVLPPKLANGMSNYFSVLHRQPVVDGYLARYSVGQIEFIKMLINSYEKNADEFCLFLRKNNIHNTIVTEDVSPLQFEKLSQSNRCTDVKFHVHPSYPRNVPIVDIYNETAELGGSWNAPGAVVLSNPLEFNFKTEFNAIGLIFWGDHNDVYSVKLIHNGEVQYEWLVPVVMSQPGIRERYVKLPHNVLFDKAVVSPVSGDGMFSLGRLSYLRGD